MTGVPSKPKARSGPVLYHPDYTVGSGIEPDLLTPTFVERSRASGLPVTAGGELHPALRTFCRRWFACRLEDRADHWLLQEDTAV